MLVTGGRHYGEATGEYTRLSDALWTIHQRTPILVLVHGYAKGADSCAREWAKYRQDGGDLVATMGFRADWDTYGKRAGPMRNQRMVDWVVNMKHDAKLVLACPGGRGTADCVAKARAANLTVKTLDEVLNEKP